MIAICCVLAYIIVEYFNIKLALYLSYFITITGLLLIGIPHGAVDHLLKKSKTLSIFQFVLKYLLIISFYFVLWQIFPIFSLVIFIIYSSFHFGEAELEESGLKISSFGAHLKAFLLGLSILLFIIFTHLPESIDLITNIPGIDIVNFDENKYSLHCLIIEIISLGVIISQLIVTRKHSYVAVLFFLILGINVPLILAFVLYFIFHHSINAWGHLKNGLNLNSFSLYKQALPYTLGAILILLTIINFDFSEIVIMKKLWTNFFIFLACISLPHFLLMHLFYQAKSE